MHVLKDALGFAIRDLNETMINFRCTGWVECIGVEV
jgi:hypothetical protein